MLNFIVTDHRQWLLNRLWLSRHKRISLPKDTIVTLGRRLVDVRFFHGHVDSAIDLAEDILYNLRQVYGPLHPSAVQMMNLLSSIYMSKGDRAAALAVHEAAESGLVNTGSQGHNQGGVTEDSSQDDKLIRSKLEDLLQSYRQEPNQGSIVQHSASLIDELARRLHTPAPQTKNGGPCGAHQPPVSWSFTIDGKDGKLDRVEELA